MLKRLHPTPLAACAILLHIGAASAAQQATEAVKTNLVTVGNGATSTSKVAYTLGTGDRIQLSAYQREDLSGMFRVRPDGTVSIPLIGSVQTDGLTPRELERNLTAAIARVTGRAVPVTVEVETWRPIYTVGDVDKPGAYPFTPGMTVLQALAVAGGVYRPLREIGALDMSRQAATVVQFNERLKLALAERARIVAEQAGTKVVEASKKLLQLADSKEVQRLVDTENSILRENRQTLNVAFKAKNQEIGHIESEIKAYREQRKELALRVKLVTEELKRYETLASKGLARSARTLQLRTEVANLEGTSHAVLASIARSERALIEANRAKETLQTEKRLGLETQLRRVEGEIRELERSLDIFEDLMLRLSSSSMSQATASKLTKLYEIVRTSAQKSEIIQATETTLLQPGDVVRIATEKQPSNDPADTAAVPLTRQLR